MRCGLLGRKLGHSYSPQIHAYLGDYSYDLFEKEPEEVGKFLENSDFSAINVTIPYKQTVMPYCAELSETARRIGAVNTIVRRQDGTLVGHNTDYFGFLSTVKRTGLEPAGKKVLIIGSGGASKPAIAVMEELKANVVVISHKENTPETLVAHSDCAILINATPVGMYPNVGISPVDLSLFPRLEGIIDMIYNPARTKLLLDAEKRGLVAENGQIRGRFPGRQPGNCRLSPRRDRFRSPDRLDIDHCRRSEPGLGQGQRRNSEESFPQSPAPSGIIADFMLK